MIQESKGVLTLCLAQWAYERKYDDALLLTARTPFPISLCQRSALCSLKDEDKDFGSDYQGLIN